jgi:hypothetical protein
MNEPSPRPWHVAAYETTERFRAVEWHEAICVDEGPDESQGMLIAVCGPAHDAGSIADAELIVRAVNALPALLAAAQGMYELHKDGVSHQLQLYQRKAALTALHAAITAATGEERRKDAETKAAEGQRLGAELWNAAIATHKLATATRDDRG